MAWQSVSFLTDAASAEPICDALIEAGALSASIEDADAGTPDEQPQFGEPGSVTTPGWAHSRVVVLLQPDDDVAALIGAAVAEVGLTALPEWTVERIEEQNWVQLTQSQFDPIRISERLWIVPSWHELPDPSAISLILDPGMAFGTGSHPTTRLCLEWLEREVKGGERMLDYGCGSGILAMAAAKLGASHVAGVDIDPQAVDAARANAERNAVVATFADSAEPVAGEYDLVVANILSNPLRVLAPAICAHVRSGGRLALSGILREQAEEIIGIYAQWLPMQVADTREDWVCLAGVKP
ncbi:50S ribosomal protein L11 methyltransferase [Dechloromonas sp. ZS-1]|uniref:50S ribosomal protein L11 methyltransferase n=1 Tax=Dechloromonas sp. ZS-1 TaxID=3138067 RepID=UPI0031FC9A9A